MMQLGGTPTTTTTASTATAPPPQSNDSAATEAAAAAVGAFEVSEEMNDRGFGGNRWPRQETLALLKIRSDMGIAFRDASVKGPLWEEVSRKMAELGYIRNAKKCKEKFENVYKYHKRTKEGRTGKSEGKTYRFFDQLEALETQSTTASLHHQQPQPPLRPHQNNNNNNNNSSIFSTPPPVTTVMPAVANISTLPSSSIPPYTQQMNVPSFPNISGDFLSDNSTSSSSSYSTSSDMDIGGGGGTKTNRKKRKRKWKEFFERLMKQVVDKQEELQRKFLEAVEKREHERLVREESWRLQEIARINREHEILAQERSMSAAKDAAVMAFLQKLSEKQPNQPTVQPQPQPQPQPQQVQPPQMQLNNNNQQQTPQPSPPSPPPPLLQPIQAIVPTSDTTKMDNGDQNMTPASASASSSRWPKVEIEALIKLRTNLDSKYQENGPKGPLWEEISAGMRRLGFNRNSKRCKEKWENINKYFKKVKESNKKRPEDSKTCPYFHQLDALYRERNKFHSSNNNNNIASSSSASGLVKPDNSVPLMVQPEQQWPPAITTTATTAVAAVQLAQHPQPSDQNFDDEEGTDEEYDDEDEDEDEENEEEEGGEFELVPSDNNKTTNNL